MSKRVDQIFNDRIVLWGERAAVKARLREVSYTELDRFSNSLARRLIQAGVIRGGIVAVATDNIVSFAIAAVAIMKAGAAYLPIDTRHTVDRNRDILLDAAPAILLTDADFSEGLIPADLLVIRDFATVTALSTFPDHAVEVPGGGDDVACIFYTSGSTGRPKGIELPHRGIPNLVGDPDFVGFGPNDRIGQASNFAFDAITFELWGALLNGGCIVQIPRDVLFSAPALAEFFELERITVIWLTTSLFNALASREPTAFGALRVLVIGGEAADPVPIGRVLCSGHSPRDIVNAYGPTETTTFATWHKVTLDDVNAGRVPIGNPIRNIKTYIADDRMMLARCGEPGELLIGGPGVANGYLHQPGLTGERFISDSFGSKPSRRLYRSGDLCCERPDGNIEYLGRIDDQVKIRGFRVEPFEVAAALRRLAGIEDAVVLARNGSFGSKELIAFVRGNNLPSVEHLRQEMADVVPDYMVPSIVWPVLDFPLTANGKLDRAALLAKIESGAVGNRIREQGDETEKRITIIWKHILQQDDIGRDQDFRALGGDSLSTMYLALEIEKTFGVAFSVDDLASPLTISRLATEVRTQLGNIVPDRPSPQRETSPKVFAVSYPWTMYRMPEQIGQALSADGWRHVQVPLNYFRTASTITIEDMAIQLDRLISSLSPEGPYVVFGHCFTGLLAYEVAQRLVAAERSVLMVVIVDSYPTLPRTPLKGARSLLRRTAKFAKLDLKSQMAKLSKKIFPVRDLSFDEFIRQACLRASDQYQPRPYPGRVVFFRPHDNPPLDIYDLTAWRRLVQGPYTEHLVDFSEGLFESAFEEIAEKLKEERPR